MSSMEGGRPPNKDQNEDPDLDLDLAADAPVMALFRETLEPPGGRPPVFDVRAVERRARRRHRRRQAMASGVVTMAAAMAAVLVVVSPWSASGTEGAPATPDDSLSVTGRGLTEDSMLQGGDLSLSLDNVGPVLGGRSYARSAKVSSTKNYPDIGTRICGKVFFDDIDPANMMTAFLTPTDQPADTTDGYDVSQQVWQWAGKPDQASALMEAVRQETAACAQDPGSEGDTLTTVHELENQGLDVPTLFSTSTWDNGTGQGIATILWGDQVVQITVQVPEHGNVEATEADALAALIAATEQASYRMTGQEPANGTTPPMNWTAPETTATADTTAADSVVSTSVTAKSLLRLTGQTPDTSTSTSTEYSYVAPEAGEGQ